MTEPVNDTTPRGTYFIIMNGDHVLIVTQNHVAEFPSSPRIGLFDAFMEEKTLVEICVGSLQQYAFNPFMVLYGFDKPMTTIANMRHVCLLTNPNGEPVPVEAKDGKTYRWLDVRKLAPQLDNPIYSDDTKVILRALYNQIGKHV